MEVLIVLAVLGVAVIFVMYKKNEQSTADQKLRVTPDSPPNVAGWSAEGGASDGVMKGDKTMTAFAHDLWLLDLAGRETRTPRRRTTKAPTKKVPAKKAPAKKAPAKKAPAKKPSAKKPNATRRGRTLATVKRPRR